MKDFLSAAQAAALAAGRLLRDNISGTRKILHKGIINLVTEMDMLSERLIVKSLRSSFPKHNIISEEEANIRKGSDFTWIIDPLDGTTNYAHGYPCFCVSIALEWESDIILGVVYDPMRDELFSAQKGKGALLNAKSIRVSSVGKLINGLLATGFPYDRKVSKINNVNYFRDLLMASQEIRRDGAAALDLCYVACGRFDGFWELKLKPWDVAAGSLMVREAGGMVSDFTGSRFSVYDHEVVASNGKVHQQMLSVLLKDEKRTIRGSVSIRR